MEPSLAQELRRTAPRATAILLVLLASLCLGCLETDPHLVDQKHPKKGIPCQMTADWQRGVYFTPDTMNNGALTPGLVGRIRFFGKNIKYPLEAAGALTVDLYDDSALRMGGQSKWLEQWTIDPDALKQLFSHDFVGWGYTVFLPWATYRPDITTIRLALRFDRENGSPLFQAGSPVILENQETTLQMALRAKQAPGGVVPAGHHAPPSLPNKP